MRVSDNKKENALLHIVHSLIFVFFVIVVMSFPRDAWAQLDPLEEMISTVGHAVQLGASQVTNQANALAKDIGMQQANRDQVSVVTANTAGAYVMKGSYCAIGKLPQTMASLKHAKLSLQQAIESVLFWAKSGKDDPNSTHHFYAVKCQMSLTPKSIACPNPAFPQYANAGTFSGAAVQNGPYKFPSDVFVIDQYGNATLQGTPSLGDMPFLQAMFSCLYKRESTPMAIDPNGTRVDETTDPGVIPHMEQDTDQQAASVKDDAYQKCISKLVNNTVIGTDAPQGLQQFRVAVAQACHYMNPSFNGTGHMSATKANDCENGNGASPQEVEDAMTYPDPARLGVAAQEGDDDHLRSNVNQAAIDAARRMLNDN